MWLVGHHVMIADLYYYGLWVKFSDRFIICCVMQNNQKESRLSRFKATSLSGDKKYHGKKLQESLERQRSHRSNAISNKRGNSGGNLFVDDTGVVREEYLSKLALQLESSISEEIESALRSINQFCVEGGNFLHIAQLIPHICRVFATCTSIFVSTDFANQATSDLALSQSYRIAGFAADILATIAQESEQCCHILLTTASSMSIEHPDSFLLQPFFNMMKSFCSAPRLSDEFCNIVMQSVRFLGGIIRFGPMEILNHSFLSDITIILGQVIEACSGTQFMLNLNVRVSSLDHSILIILDEALWCFVYVSARVPFNLLSTLFLTYQSFGNNKDSVTIIRSCLTSFKSVIENHQFLREQPQHQLISSCVSCVVPITRIVSNIVADRECSLSVLEQLLPITADVSSIFWHLMDAFQNSPIFGEMNLKTLSLSIWRMWQCILEDFVSHSLPATHSISRKTFFYDGHGENTSKSQSATASEATFSVSSILLQLNSLLWHCFASDLGPMSPQETHTLRFMSVAIPRITRFCVCVAPMGRILEEAPEMLHSVLHVCYLLAMSLQNLEKASSGNTHIEAQIRMLRNCLISGSTSYSGFEAPAIEANSSLFCFLKEIFSNQHGNGGSFANSIRCDYLFVETAFFLLHLSLFVLDHCYEKSMKHRVFQIMVSLDVAENIELLQYSSGVNEDVACLAEQLLEQIYACMEMDDNEGYN